MPRPPRPTPRSGHRTIRAMTERKKSNPLIELVVTIVLPALVLTKLSPPDRLGQMPALLLGLAFPLGWGLWEWLKGRKVSWLAALGVVSTLLTAAIGLLALDARWLAIKEAAVPLLIGVVILGSCWTRTPLIRLMVFNDALFDTERIQKVLAERQATAAFDRTLQRATAGLAATFFFSSVANFLLARHVVTSAAGTTEFTQELGRLTALSYPVIALPCMVMMMGLFWWLAQQAKRLTGLDLGELMAAPPAEAKD